MSEQKLKEGFFPALGTPTDKDGKLMEPSYARQIDLMILSGAAGVLCMGSMGKMESIRNSEYPGIAEKCVDFVSGRIPVMVGVMDCSAARVHDRIEALGDIKIDGVVATVPFYSKVNAGGIINFFTQVADVSKHPLYIYDLPSVTQAPLTSSILEPLMKIRNIRGMKTANLNMILDLMRNNAVRDDFSILYSGLDSFDAAIQAGIKRNLDGMFACTPHNSKMMYEDIDKPDSRKISKYLNNILRLRNIFLKEDVLAAFSYAMELLGCPGNYHCDYAVPVSEKLKADIQKCMKDIEEI
jgi:4-hydroxy-tetrahydrodipicolinate synthase